MKTNKFIYILSFAALAGLLGACAKEPINDNGNFDEPCTIIAQVGDFTDTKTCVDESVTSRMDMLWDGEESIGVYTSTANQSYPWYPRRNIEFTCGASKAKTAEFTTTTTISGEPMYAYYPYKTNLEYSSYLINGNNLKLDLTQSYSTEDGKIASDWKVGRTSSTSSPYTFKFEHLFSLMRFTVDATGTDLQGKKLQSISLTFNNDVSLTYGTFRVNLSTKEVDNWQYSQTGKTMTLNVTDTPDLSANTSYKVYMVMPPANVAQKAVNVKVTATDETAVSFTATLNQNLVKNRAYNFPLKLSDWVGSNGGNSGGDDEGRDIEDIVNGGSIF